MFHELTCVSQALHCCSSFYPSPGTSPTAPVSLHIPRTAPTFSRPCPGCWARSARSLRMRSSLCSSSYIPRQARSRKMQLRRTVARHHTKPRRPEGCANDNMVRSMLRWDVNVRLHSHCQELETVNCLRRPQVVRLSRCQTLHGAPGRICIQIGLLFWKISKAECSQRW